MRLNRLRRGELIALAGAVGLLIVMFFDWFAPNSGLLTPHDGFQIPSGARKAAVDRVLQYQDAFAQSGWQSLGWLADILIALAIVVCLAWLIATVTLQSPALPVAGEVVTIALGGLGLLSVLVRLILQPGLDLGFSNAQVDTQKSAYFGAIFALMIVAGAWTATADERTDAPYSAAPDVELRPIPDPS